MNSGEKYGKLTTVREIPERKSGHILWECVCDCGKTTIVARDRLLNGHTRSCGCLKRQESNLIHDMTGKRIGRLLVIRRQGTRRNNALWLCRCDCGNEKLIAGADLRSGKVFSCGCQKIEHTTKHGGYKERLYSIWSAMRDRCNNSSNKNYKNYGGRGISVCKEWSDYSFFREWALKNGYSDTANYGECSLDRIDVNGDYKPDNCRIISLREQQNNKQNTIKVTRNGITKSIAGWCDELGVSRSNAYYRRKIGLPEEEWFKPV